MVVFIIEAAILCLMFTLSVLYASKNPINDINNYPPKIIDKCYELGLISKEQFPKSKKVIRKKLIACLVFLILFVVIVYKFNGARSFFKGFVISYGLWFVVDWYDAIVLDCIWFCHSKRFIIPGTEDMVDEYHNYWFHIWGSIKGMIIGLPVCLIVGLIVKML